MNLARKANFLAWGWIIICMLGMIFAPENDLMFALTMLIAQLYVMTGYILETLNDIRLRCVGKASQPKFDIQVSHPKSN